MNPFNEKPISIKKCVSDWKKLYPTAYNKHDADAYTKVRTILLNGLEFEQNWFMHQLARHTTNNELRRDVAFCEHSNSNNKNAFLILSRKTNLFSKQQYLMNSLQSI